MKTTEPLVEFSKGTTARETEEAWIMSKSPGGGGVSLGNFS